MNYDMEQVTLDIRWPELFGEQPSDMDARIRRERWEEWKRLGSENVEMWSTPDGPCLNCPYRDNDWCTAISLPCTINPILTFQFGMLGLACGGVNESGTAATSEIEDEQIF